MKRLGDRGVWILMQSRQRNAESVEEADWIGSTEPIKFVGGANVPGVSYV